MWHFLAVWQDHETPFVFILLNLFSEPSLHGLAVYDTCLGLLVGSDRICNIVTNSPFMEGIHMTNINRDNRTGFKEYRSISSY
jgi:hypothetical protein